jgi:ABC-2 type transport system permease protein
VTPGRELEPLVGWSAIRVVTRREVRERTRSRAFKVGTVIMLLLAAALGLLPRLLPEADDPEWTVVAVGQAPAGLEEALRTVTEVESASIELRHVDGAPQALAADDDIDAVLVDGRELVAEDPPPERLQILLSSALAQARLTENLSALGVDPAEAADLLALEPLQVRSTMDDDAGARELVAFLGTVVMFIAIVSYGNWVLYSVLEEKANRIVELIVSAIRPADLLAGKVIGVGLVGISQLVLILAAGGVAAALAGTLPDLPPFVPGAVAWALLWFVLGFAFYAVGYAAAGSLTARQEDAQSAASPLLTLVLVAYFASVFFVGPDPGGTTARVLSILPLTAPIAMPNRIALGEVEGWEIAVAVVVMLGATWAMTRLAATVYRRALLHSGGRLKVVEALRSTRG